MIKNKIGWGMIGAVLVLAVVAVIKFTPLGQSLVWAVSDGGEWLLPLLLITALVDSLNPCAFSVLLLTIAFLLSLGASRGRLLAVGGVYIAGIFAAYLLIGFGLLQALHFFNTPHFMAKIGAVILVVVGALALSSGWWPNFPLKLKIPQVSHKWIAKLMHEASLPTAFLLGIVVGLCEFPCTGGPYLAAIGLLHDGTTYLKGAAYLVFYNLVFVLPLVIILAVAADRLVLSRLESWRANNLRSLKLWSGAAMIIIGLLIFLL